MMSMVYVQAMHLVVFSISRLNTSWL